MSGAGVTVRSLGPADRAAAARIARDSFCANPFYERALGLQGASFERFWSAFFRLALGDPRCRVMGVECDGDLAGFVVAVRQGFPGTRRGLCYLIELAAGIGPVRVVRYLRFVHAYERAMRRPDPEEATEARCYWLAVRPDRRASLLGSRLVRETARALSREGLRLATGFIDAGNAPLIAFYRRLGFRIGPSFLFPAGPAARIELDLIPFAEAPPC
jgi:ribosomal protein S18 acetylase RimI-like enzyme